MSTFLAADFPEKIALRFAKEELSFAQLQQSIDQMVLQLQKLPDGIVLLAATPTPVLLIQLLAALTMGKPVALCSEADYPQRQALLGRSLSIDAQGELVAVHKNNPIHHHPQLALLLFTSGSSGQVKAVQLSQANILANCHAVMTALEFSQIHDQLLFLPLSYSFGLLGQLLPGLMAGITTQLLGQFTEMKPLLETGSVPQMWSGVPSHWVALSKMAALYPESAAKIKAVVSAGAPLAIPLRANLSKAFPNAIVYNNYGLTEASPRVLTYSSKDPLFLEDYAGYPIGDWQVRLSTEDELLIKGQQLMLGYLGEEQATRIHEDWLFTGDLASILPSGLIAIKERRDNQVNIAGEKVNLTEIEHKICQLDGIKEVIVLPLADELYGVRLLACVEQNAFTATLSEQQLGEQLQLHFLPQKLPIKVLLLAQLPRNQHGKLDRNALLLNYKDKVHAH